MGAATQAAAVTAPARVAAAEVDLMVAWRVTAEGLMAMAGVAMEAATQVAAVTVQVTMAAVAVEMVVVKVVVESTAMEWLVAKGRLVSSERTQWRRCKR